MTRIPSLNTPAALIDVNRMQRNIHCMQKVISEVARLSTHAKMKFAV